NPNEFRILIASDKNHYEDYKSLPHLFQPKKSVMDPDVLSGLFKELNDRHNQFRRAHVRNLNSFNQRVSYESRKSVIADRKSTRLNSSHVSISYAVFCLKKKKNIE